MVDTTEREPPPSEYAAKVIRSVVISYDTIATIVNLACLTFLFWYRKKPIVAMGQYRLLAVMCVGSLFWIVGTVFMQVQFKIFLSEFEFSKKYTTTFCFLGNFAVHAILFLKLYRVYKVMRFRRNQQVLARHIIVPFLVCLIPPLVFGSLHQFGNYKTVYFWLYQVSLWSMRIALLVFAWILRNVKESVGDTRKILRYVVFQIIIWSFFWVYKLRDFAKKIRQGNDYSDASWIISSMFRFLPSFLHSVAPAIFLVFPRMYLLWYKRVHGHLPDHVTVYGSGNVHVNADLNTRHGAANANANANAGTTTKMTTTTETTTATVSQAEASVENPAAPTTTDTGKKNTTVAKTIDDGRDGGSSRQQSTNDDDDDDDSGGGAAAAAVANV